MGYGIGFGLNLFEIMFTLVFVLVIGMFLVFAVKGIAQWNQNNHSPRLTVPAAIVAKRTNVTRHHHGGAGGHHHHRPGPLLQRPGPDEVPEEGQHRGQRRGHPPGPAGPLPPGDLL